jgi:hypothetical protein
MYHYTLRSFFLSGSVALAFYPIPANTEVTIKPIVVHNVHASDVDAAWVPVWQAMRSLGYFPSWRFNRHMETIVLSLT